VVVGGAKNMQQELCRYSSMNPVQIELNVYYRHEQFIKNMFMKLRSGVV
jgi:hypothetical protein